MTGIKILSTGSCLPRRVVTNDDMAALVDTSDEWIATRTGIRRRRFASPGEDTASLAVGAARAALEEGDIPREKIGAVVVATFTPSTLVPNTACLVQRELGLPAGIMAMDLNSACSGFLYGLRVAQGLLCQDPDRYVLVIGAEVLSRVTDFADRSTCVLFGDGAGAAVVAAAPGAPFFWAAGARGDAGALRCGGPALDAGAGEPMAIRMDGREVFRFAVDAVPRAICEVMVQAGLTAGEIDWYLCHQANARIISHVAKVLREPPEKFFLNLEEYGNTSAASIPIALDEMNRRGLLQRGQRLALAGFGGGLTWGAALMEW